MTFDGKAFGEMVVAQVKAYFAREIAPIVERVIALENANAPLQGEKGAKGDIGESGPRGEKGETGEQGAQGLVGERGEKGEKGDAGTPGERGEKGGPGENGIQGIPGERGEKGDPGEKGLTGEIGALGEKGDVGEKGEKGEVGERGPAVSDADLAFSIEAALAPLREQVFKALSDKLEERIANIPPAKDGKDGTNGINGKDADPVPTAFTVDANGDLIAFYPDGQSRTLGRVRGKDGARGASVMDASIDANGHLVERLSDGRLINAGNAKGEPGKNGEPGETVHGRDAVALVFLPGIDETRAYLQGTCALHRGGTIRAMRNTSPVVDGNILEAGWAVMMEGIFHEEETEYDDGREIVKTTTYTSGKTVTRRRTTSALIYRGIWEQREFLPGDTVTWDGSSWHCNAPTKLRPGMPESAGDWRLMTKRGRDGKNAGETKH